MSLPDAVILFASEFLESEIIAEGVGHFSPKPNSNRTATVERRKAKSPTSDAISWLPVIGLGVRRKTVGEAQKVPLEEKCPSRLSPRGGPQGGN